MKTSITVVILLILIGGGVYVYTRPSAPVIPVENAPVVCTMEAKLCPDGSYVGRSGPNCEFADCPTITPIPGNTTSTTTTTVTTNGNAPIACTADAKLCPNGSYVGRTGPNCSFAPCPTTTTTTQTTVTTTPTPAPAPVVQNSVLVTLTDSGFVPSTVTIARGDTVKFTNDSSINMWVASNPHPTHTGYPGFDEHASVPKGGSWSFTFNNSGTWGYHDHVAPNTGGVVVVK